MEGWRPPADCWNSAEVAAGPSAPTGTNTDLFLVTSAARLLLGHHAVKCGRNGHLSFNHVSILPFSLLQILLYKSPFRTPEQQCTISLKIIPKQYKTQVYIQRCTVFFRSGSISIIDQRKWLVSFFYHKWQRAAMDICSWWWDGKWFWVLSTRGHAGLQMK